MWSFSVWRVFRVMFGLHQTHHSMNISMSELSMSHKEKCKDCSDKSLFCSLILNIFLTSTLPTLVLCIHLWVRHWKQWQNRNNILILSFLIPLSSSYAFLSSNSSYFQWKIFFNFFYFCCVLLSYLTNWRVILSLLTNSSSIIFSLSLINSSSLRQARVFRAFLCWKKLFHS